MSNPHEETPDREQTGPLGHDPEHPGPAPDETTAFDTQEPTAPYASTATDRYGSTSQYGGPDPTRYEPGTPEPEQQQRWARGTSWATVAFGLVCMAVAGLALTLQLTDLRVDWEVAGPATVVGLGALLVLVGLVGLLSQRREE
jgi:hypothetical protein